jgi:hypothetical protein
LRAESIYSGITSAQTFNTLLISKFLCMREGRRRDSRSRLALQKPQFCSTLTLQSVLAAAGVDVRMGTIASGSFLQKPGCGAGCSEHACVGVD